MPLDNINDPWRHEEEEPEINAAPPPAQSSQQPEQDGLGGLPEVSTEEQSQFYLDALARSQGAERFEPNAAPEEPAAPDEPGPNDIVERAGQPPVEEQEPPPDPYAPTWEQKYDIRHVDYGMGMDDERRARDKLVDQIKAQVRFSRDHGQDVTNEEWGDNEQIDAVLNGYGVRENFSPEATNMLNRFAEHVGVKYQAAKDEISRLEGVVNTAKNTLNPNAIVEGWAETTKTLGWMTGSVSDQDFEDYLLDKMDKDELSRISDPGKVEGLKDVHGVLDAFALVGNVFAEQSSIIAESMIVAGLSAATGGAAAGAFGGARLAAREAAEKAVRKEIRKIAEKKALEATARKAGAAAAKAATEAAARKATAKSIGSNIGALVVDAQFNLGSSAEQRMSEAMARGSTHIDKGAVFGQAAGRTFADYFGPIRKMATRPFRAGTTIQQMAADGVLTDARTFAGGLVGAGARYAKDAFGAGLSFEGETISDRITNKVINDTYLLNGERDWTDAIASDLETFVKGGIMSVTGIPSLARRSFAEVQMNRAVDAFADTNGAAFDNAFAKSRRERDTFASPGFHSLDLTSQRSILEMNRLKAKLDQENNLAKSGTAGEIGEATGNAVQIQNQIDKLRETLSPEGRKWVDAYNSQFNRPGVGMQDFDKAVKSDPNVAAKLQTEYAPDVSGVDQVVDWVSKLVGKELSYDNIRNAANENGGLVIDSGNVRIRIDDGLENGLVVSVCRTDGGPMADTYVSEFRQADFAEEGESVDSSDAFYKTLQAATGCARKLSSWAKWSDAQTYGRDMSFANALAQKSGRNVTIIRSARDLVNAGLVDDRGIFKGSNEQVLGDLPNGLNGKWRGVTTGDGHIYVNASAYRSPAELAAIVDHESFHSRLIEMMQNGVGEKEAQKVAADFEKKTGKPLSEDNLKRAIRATILGVELTADDFAGLQDDAIDKILDAREERLAYDSEGMIPQKQRVPMLQKLFRNIPLLKDHLSRYMSEQLGRAPTTQEEMADYLFTVMSNTKSDGGVALIGVPTVQSLEAVATETSGEGPQNGWEQTFLPTSQEDADAARNTTPKATENTRQALGDLIVNSLKDGIVRSKNKSLVQQVAAFLEGLGVDVTDAKMEGEEYTVKIDANDTVNALMYLLAGSGGEAGTSEAVNTIIKLADALDKNVNVDEDGSISFVDRDAEGNDREAPAPEATPTPTPEPEQTPAAEPVSAPLAPEGAAVDNTTPTEGTQNGQAEEVTQEESEFRKLQEASRGMPAEEREAYRRGNRVPDEGLRQRLATVLGRRAAAAYGGENPHRVETVRHPRTGREFNLRQVDGQTFRDVFEVARSYLKNGELVDLHDSYGDDVKCFLTDDGLCGFAVEPDGNLVSVFSLKNNFLTAVAPLIKAAGATHLDAYNSMANQPLGEIYSHALGFRVASSMDYNMEYDHDDIAKNHGSPNVVFMVLPKDGQTVEPRHFGQNEYDAAVAKQKDDLDWKPPKEEPKKPKATLMKPPKAEARKKKGVNRIEAAVKKFNDARAAALEKIGDDGSLFMDSGSTIQSIPEYVSDMRVEVGKDAVTVSWEEDFSSGWGKPKRTTNTERAAIEEDGTVDVDSVIEAIKYKLNGVKRAVKYYEQVTPENEESVLERLSGETGEEEDGAESPKKPAAPPKTKVRTDTNGKRTLKKPEAVAPAPVPAPAPAAPVQTEKPANVPQPVESAKAEKKKTLRRRSVAAAKQESARAEAKRDLRGESKAGVATAFQQRNAARAARDRALEGKVAARGVKGTNGKNVRSDAKQGTVSERAEEIAQQSIQIAGLGNATGTDAVLDAARNAIINAEYSSAGPNDKIGAIARIAYETRQRDAAAADALVNNGLSRKPDVNNPITPEEAVAAKPDTIDDLILQSLSPDGPFDTLQEALRIMDSDAAAEAHGPAAVDAVLRAIEPLLDLPVEEVPPAIAERAAALQDRMDRLVLGKSAGSSENQLSKVRAVREALAAQHPVKDFASRLIGNEDALYSLESELNRRTERASVQDQNIENRGEVSENEDEENPETAQEALMNGVSDREDELDIPDTDIDRTMFASEESLRKAEKAGLSSRNMVQSRQRRTTTNGIQRPEEGRTQEIASGAKALAGRDAGAAADVAARSVRNGGRIGIAVRIASAIARAEREGGANGAVQAGYAGSQAARGELGRRLERLVRQEAVINHCWAAQGIEAALRRQPRLEETELFGSETSTIFKDKAANQVFKVTRASYADPTAFWYRMALFNSAFGPDTGVGVLGYGLNELGEFSIIGLQQYVEKDDAATAKLTPQRIFTYLKTVFGPNLRKTGDYAFETPLVTIRDAGPGNVVVDKQGRIRVIDIDIDPKPALKDAMTDRFGREQSSFASDESLRAASRPSGVQKSADVNYPDAGAEISAARFASIGSQRKAEMTRLLGKHRPDLNVDEVVAELEKFGTVKEQKAALHWVIRGGLALPQDAYKVADALSVAEKAKVDPFRYKSPDELLLANKDFKPSARPIDPATVPELSDARDEGDGIVSYLVQDDRQGQAAMRRIIDTHWGEDANPWCLLSKQPMSIGTTQEYNDWLVANENRLTEEFINDTGSEPETEPELYVGFIGRSFEKEHNGRSGLLMSGNNLDMAWTFWQQYSSLPKRVAFKNGRLLAFMATERGQGDGKVEFSKPENERRVESFYKEYSKIPKDERPGNFQQWMMEEHPEEYDAIAEDEQDGGDAINTYQFSRPAEEWWDRQDESHPDLDWAREGDYAQSRFANEDTLRMASDLERKYPLMAVHGLSLGSLRKALDEGALVMPSIAVRNHGDTWRQAGYVDENTKDFVPAAQQVFVLFPKHTIADENTDMFYGDAYTPTINSLLGDYSQENIDRTREEFELNEELPASKHSINYLDDARMALRPRNVELDQANADAASEFYAIQRELADKEGVPEDKTSRLWILSQNYFYDAEGTTESDIEELVRTDGWVPEQYVKRLADIIARRLDAKWNVEHDNSGTNLVEAKAWRRVPFSEAAAVLIDNSAPKDVERILKYNGVDNVVRINMADPNALADAQSTFAPRFASAESLRAAEGGLTGNALSDPNIVRLALGPVRVKNPDGTVSFATKVTDLIRAEQFLKEDPKFAPWAGRQNLRAVFAEAGNVLRKDPAAAERIKEKVLDAYKKYQAGDKNAAARLSVSAHDVQVLRAMLVTRNQALVAANDAVADAENNGADNLNELRVAELNAEAQYYDALMACGFAERAIGTALGSIARLMENDFSMGGLLKKLGDVDGGVTAEDAKKLRGVSREGEAAQKKHDDAVKAIEEEERKKLVAGKVDDAVGEGRRNKAAGRKAKTVAEAVEAARKELADGEIVDISVYPELWAQIGDAVKGIARAIIGEHLEGPSRLKALDHAAFAKRLLAETKKAYEGRITSRDENHKELTERDVLDLFSDYGDPEKLQEGYGATDIGAGRLREAQSRLKKLSQMMSALEDIKAGKPPLEAYGHLRDLTPKQVDEEMERVKKEMDEAWRASGLDKNLLHRAMSPLELVRDGIEKRIAEIKANLAAGELAKKQGRKPIAGEEGLAGLREELKRLQSIQDSVFKNRGLTDEQRLSAIEENYRRTEASAMATLQRLMAGGRPVKPLDMSDDGARSAWATAERAWRQKIGEARHAAADATRRLNELRRRMTPESYRGEKALEQAIARREDMTARWEEAVNAGRVTLGGRGIMRDPKMRFDPRLVEADRAYREVIAKRDRLIAEIKYDHAKGWEKLKMNLSAIPNTMRQMLASGDNSGIGVQCAVATLANPKDGIKAIFPGIKVFWNTLFGNGMATERYMESLYRDPDFERIAAYVEIPRTDGKGNFTQNSTEEFFQHGVVAERLQKILHVPIFDNKYMRASEAGFNVPVAMIRFELAKRLLAHLRDMKGEGYTPTNEEMSLLGKVVNAATGRGKFFSGGGPVNLSNVFWASGRVSGQVESLFLPARLFLKHGEVDLAFRKKIARELIWKPWRNFAAAALLFGLAHAIFKDEDDDDPFMELDPTSSKFLRMKVGTRYFDITSGMPSYITLVAKGIWGEKKTVGGKRVALRGQGAFGQSWSNELWRFFRNKLRPEYGNIISLFDGRNAIGEEIEPTPLGVSKFLAVNGFLPLTAKDIVDSIEDFDRNGPLFTASLALLANIGYTTSNFGQTPYKNDRAAIETIDEVRKQAEAGVEGMDDAWSDIALNEDNARYIKAASDKQMVKLASRIKELDGLIRNGEATKAKSGRVVSRRKLTREERRAAEREKDALEAEYHERLWPELKRIR